MTYLLLITFTYKQIRFIFVWFCLPQDRGFKLVKPQTLYSMQKRDILHVDRCFRSRCRLDIHTDVESWEGPGRSFLGRNFGQVWKRLGDESFFGFPKDFSKNLSGFIHPWWFMILHFYNWPWKDLEMTDVAAWRQGCPKKDSMLLKSNKRYLQMFQIKSIYKILRCFLQSWKQVEKKKHGFCLKGSDPTGDFSPLFTSSIELWEVPGGLIHSPVRTDRIT